MIKLLRLLFLSLFQDFVPLEFSFTPCATSATKESPSTFSCLKMKVRQYPVLYF